MISAGLKNANSPENYIPSPNTLLEVERLTRRMGRVHIETPNSTQNSQNTDSNLTIQTTPSLPSTPISPSTWNDHIFPSQEVSFQHVRIPNGQSIYVEHRYQRIKKLSNIKLHFDDFLSSFSEKEWFDGVPLNTFRMNFQNYFRIPISKSGIGQLVEVKERLIRRRKIIRGKLVVIYKKR